jgi:hypothetical protein
MIQRTDIACLRLRTLGHRQRHARSAGRGAPGGREPDPERVGPAGGGHPEEHHDPPVQTIGAQERGSRDATLRVQTGRVPGGLVDVSLKMKKP